MNKYRKQIVLGVVGAAVLWFLGSSLYQSQISGPLEARRASIEKLQDQVRTRQRELERVRKATRELEGYQAQSLPSNPELARSLYEAWLLGLVEQAGFTNPNVDSSEPSSRKGLYQSLTFSIRGRGTLDQLTRFLYDFYGADHLHQIRSLTLMPQPTTGQIDVSITVEALVLPRADRADRLSNRRSERLAYDKLDDYQVIAQRNLFGVGGAMAATDHTFLTAINYVDGQPELWFTVRTDDNLLRLHKGDPIEVGSFRGVVADIYGTDVILESDGERWLLTVGESISQASALPPEF